MQLDRKLYEKNIMCSFIGKQRFKSTRSWTKIKKWLSCPTLCLLLIWFILTLVVHLRRLIIWCNDGKYRLFDHFCCFFLKIKQCLQVIFKALNSCSIRLNFSKVLNVLYFSILNWVFKFFDFESIVFQDDFRDGLSIISTYELNKKNTSQLTKIKWDLLLNILNVYFDLIKLTWFISWLFYQFLLHLFFVLSECSI